MYSRNKLYRRGNTSDYGIADEEEELYSYNLPPRYDGSRFSPCRRRFEETHPTEKEIIEEPKAEDSVIAENDCVEETKKPSCDSVSELIRSVGAEELLIIAVMLMIAGSEDGGELLVLLILLLIHG